MNDGYYKWHADYDKNHFLIRRTYIGLDGPVKNGIQVNNVVPGSQAEKIGVKAGDWILSYDGKEAHNTEAFIRLTRSKGTQMRELKILRNGSELTFHVKQGSVGMSISDQMIR